MHVLFVHRNFPAQFGHIAARLIAERGHRCTFLSETPSGVVEGIRKVQYAVKGGATAATNYHARSFENAISHSEAVYEAARRLKLEGSTPDLIVGHSGFGSTLFLRELFPDVPLINYFEYFYRTRNSDLDFRTDFPVSELDRLRARARNATILLDLDACDAGVSPTSFQQELLPAEYRQKVRVIHDGVPTDVWRPLRWLAPERSRRLGQMELDPGTRVVTYVSRGLESMRGFDVFIKMAKRICELRSDVVFAVVGADRVAYGGDQKRIGRSSFKDWVLEREDVDLRRFHFLGRIPPLELAMLFSVSDLHVYLTVPFVLSWSMLDAMACGCTLLASDTAPVREVVRHGENGYLCDFFDSEALAEQALAVLDDPQAHRSVAERAVETIHSRYSTDVLFPKMADFYEQVAAGLGAATTGPGQGRFGGSAAERVRPINETTHETLPVPTSPSHGSEVA